MDDKILSLMFQYFQADIFTSNLKEETRAYIIEKFTEFAKEGLTNEDVNRRLQGTKLRKLKYHISVKNYAYNKAFPVKLGELKPELQKEAYSKDISLHKYIREILKKRRK